MSAPGRIIRGSLTATESRNILAEGIKVNIVVNGKEQVNQSIVKKSGDICSCTIFRDPIELKQCESDDPIQQHNRFSCLPEDMEDDNYNVDENSKQGKITRLPTQK